MTRKPLYILTLSLSLGGYLWLLFQILYSRHIESLMEGVCLIKTATGIPCPSCGSTRSVVSLLEGRILDAMYWNPLGIILAILLVILPIWVVIDLMRNQSTFYNNYKKMETIFQNKIVIVISILLILSNWIWNIIKGL